MDPEQQATLYWETISRFDKYQTEMQKQSQIYAKASQVALSRKNIYEPLIEKTKKSCLENRKANEKIIKIVVDCNQQTQQQLQRGLNHQTPVSKVLNMIHMHRQRSVDFLHLIDKKIQAIDIQLILNQDLNTNIRFIYLSHNNIGSSGAAILTSKHYWDCLTTLELEENRIIEFQISPQNTPKLTHLYLGRNQLSNLPDNITQLKQTLKYFTIDNNRFKTIPPCLLQLNLEVLSIYYNEIPGIQENPIYKELSQKVEFRFGIKQRQE